MARYAGSGRTTCESCHAIDVRRWYRMGRLSAGQWFSWQWTCNGEPTGNISVRTEARGVVLHYRSLSNGADWETVEQRVPIVWSECTYGGVRPWFQCAVYSNGRFCGRRVAKLYGAGKLFACRHCYRLVYACQQQSPHWRTLAKAQKIRMQLGGSGSLDEPFPAKPKGMHERTYMRLQTRSLASAQRADALLLSWMAKRFS